MNWSLCFFSSLYIEVTFACNVGDYVTISIQNFKSPVTNTQLEAAKDEQQRITISSAIRKHIQVMES